MSASRKGLITDIHTYDTRDMDFGPVSAIDIPGMTVSPGRRIPIKTKTANGESRPFYIITEPNLFSWGVQPPYGGQQGDRSKGCAMSLRLSETAGRMTAREEKFIEMFDKIVNRCKEHILSSSKELGFKSLKADDSKFAKFNRIRRSDPEDVPPKDPAMYVPLSEDSSGNIQTRFRDHEGRVLPVDRILPTLLKTRCNVRMVMLINAIFIGKTMFTLQIRAIEVKYELVDNIDAPFMDYDTPAVTGRDERTLASDEDAGSDFM